MPRIAAKFGFLVLILAGFVLGVALALTGAVGFLVARPDLVKPLAQKALAFQGGEYSIKEIKIGWDPVRVSLLELRGKNRDKQGMLLNLDRLEVILRPWEGLRTGAWLKTLSLDRPDIDLVLPAAGTSAPSPQAGGPDDPGATTLEVPDLSLLGLLPGLEELSLNNGRVALKTQAGALELKEISAVLIPAKKGPAQEEPAGLTLKTLVGLWDENGRAIYQGPVTGQGEISPEPEISLDLTLEQGRFSLDQGRGRISAQARILLDRDRLTLESLTSSLDGLTLEPVEGVAWSDLEIILEARGRADLEGGGFSGELLKLVSPGLMELSGKVRGSAKDGLKGRVEGVLEDPARFLARLGPLLPPEAASLKVDGPLSFQADLEGDRVRAEAIPKGLNLDWKDKGQTASIKLDTENNLVALSGPLVGPFDLSGSINGTGRYSGQGVKAKKIKTSLTLAGTTDSPAMENLVLEIPPKALVRDGKVTPLGRVRLKGRAELPPETDPVLTIKALKLEHLGTFTGEVSFPKAGPRVKLVNKKVDLAGLRQVLDLAGVDARGWTYAGKAGVELGLTAGPGEPGLKLRVDLKEASLSSSDGEILVDRLRGGLALDRPPGRNKEARLKVDLKGGEALLKTIYLNLDQDPLSIEAAGKYRTASKNPILEKVRFQARSGLFGTAAFKGDLARKGREWRYQGNLSLDKGDLARMFKTLIKEPFSITNPGLANLDLTGRAGLSLDLKGRGKRVAVQGRARVEEADLAGPGPDGKPTKLVQGLSLDLPLNYHLGVGETAEPAPPGDKEWGRLRVAKIRLPMTEIAGLDLPVALKPNRLFLGGGIEMDLFGGILSLSGITVDRPLGKDFSARLRLGLRGLDLSRVGDKDMPLEGRLQGRLDTVRLGLESLETTGLLRGVVFGGRVEVGGIAASRPFSPARTVGADVAYDKIHLERMSDAFGVGRITGRVSGRIEDLRIAYGQPVGFEMDLLSVKEKGVQQKVNLKAVNTISVLGTGAGLEGLGIKLMTKIFKDFPYKKIGIRCTLNNDVFRVRGLIREGGKEYLVKKPPLSGINVVNSNPDNRISFSDMKERLKRVTSSKEGPTIK